MKFLAFLPWTEIRVLFVQCFEEHRKTILLYCITSPGDNVMVVWFALGGYAEPSIVWYRKI